MGFFSYPQCAEGLDQPVRGPEGREYSTKLKHFIFFIVRTHKLLSDFYFLTRMSSTSESLPWASGLLLRFTSGGVSRFHLWWPLLPRFTSGGVSRFHLWWPLIPGSLLVARGLHLWWPLLPRFTSGGVDAPTDNLPSGKHTKTHTQACDGVTDS